MESSDQFAKTGSGQRQRRIQTATVFRPFLTVFRPFFDRFLWPSASAAFAFRTIPHLDGVVDILSWWTFTDVFEEGGAKESPFLRYLYIKTIILPRQARDKYRESTQKRVLPFSHTGAVEAMHARGVKALLPCT